MSLNPLPEYQANAGDVIRRRWISCDEKDAWEAIVRQDPDEIGLVISRSAPINGYTKRMKKDDCDSCEYKILWSSGRIERYFRIKLEVIFKAAKS